MALDERETSDKHQEVWALLPWYVMGNLDADEHEMVERYISTCPLCQKEVIEQKRLASAVSERHYLDGAIVPNVIKQDAKYETLTDNAVVAGEFLRIKAADSIGKASMLAVFEAHNLEVLSGPSQTGVYTVRAKNKQSLTPIFTKISDAPEVAFVSHLQGNN